MALIERPLIATFLLLATAASASSQVVLVESGHKLARHVDSAVPLHPSQTQLDAFVSPADIESIAIDPFSGDLYIQLVDPPGAAPGATTHIFRVNVPGGVVTPIALNTGFGVVARGVDMHFDPMTNLLVTQDQNTVPERLAFVDPFTGITGTYSFVTTPPIFGTGTFGMQFSMGAGGSVVPPGDIVFTGDVAAGGIHQSWFGAPFSVTHVSPTAFAGGGDDMVIQPDGDWIHVGDFTTPISQVLPFPPHPVTPSPLDIQTIFTNAGLPFTCGSRAAVCPVTGDFYMTASCAPGGAGLFRVDEQLTTAKLILTVGMPNQSEGIQDLVVGRSTLGPGNSIYFTVHDTVTGGEEVWEVTATACCPAFAGVVPRPDPTGLNVPVSLNEFPLGNQPGLGNFGFAVGLDDPSGACGLTPGSSTFMLLAFGPGTLLLPGFGCAPGGFGNLQLTLVPTPILLGGITGWPGPGIPAVHPFPIPFDSGLCGASVSLQGFWFDPTVLPSGRLAFSWALDLVLGS